MPDSAKRCQTPLWLRPGPDEMEPANSGARHRCAEPGTWNWNLAQPPVVVVVSAGVVSAGAVAPEGVAVGAPAMAPAGAAVATVP